jgi:HEAT repeat protein
MNQSELQRYLSELDSVDKDVRLRALKNIVPLIGQNAVPTLLVHLKDKDKFIRSYAIKFLVELTGTSHRDDIVPLLSDDSELVQQNAVKILRSIEVAQLEPLLDGYRNLGVFARANLAKIFNNRQSEKAFRFLIESLTDNEEYMRRNAAYGLEGCNNLEAAPHLIKRLQDVGPLVRSASARSLGMLRDPRALEPLLEALKTEVDFLARQGVIWGLGYYQDKRAMEALQSITFDLNESVDIQLSTVIALTSAGSFSRNTLKEIARKAPRAEVRTEAQAALTIKHI